MSERLVRKARSSVGHTCAVRPVTSCCTVSLDMMAISSFAAFSDSGEASPWRERAERQRGGAEHEYDGDGGMKARATHDDLVAEAGALRAVDRYFSGT